MTQPTPEEIQDFDRAQEGFQKAQDQLGKAVADLRKAIALSITMEARLAGSNAKDRLIAIAASCRANWSGGAASVSNILETITREEALYHIQYRLIHDIK